MPLSAKGSHSAERGCALTSLLIDKVELTEGKSETPPPPPNSSYFCSEENSSDLASLRGLFPFVFREKNFWLCC